MNKQPEVTARTRQKLLDAFWELAADEPIGKIPVGSVAKSAGCNRSTFYAYFTDMPDLLRQAEEEILKDLRDRMASFARLLMEEEKNGQEKSGPKEEPFVIRQNDGIYPTQRAFTFIFSILDERLYCLLGPNGDPTFSARMKEEFLPQIKQYFGLPAQLPHMDYIFAFAYSAIIGYAQYWHEQNKSLSEEEFYALGYRLMCRGIFGAVVEESQNESAATEESLIGSKESAADPAGGGQIPL